MNDRPVSVVLSALESVTGRKATRNGSGWKTRCPAHDDKQPSLTIAVGDDDRALLHCHAGCPVEAIVKSLGLTMRNLMPPSMSASTQATAPHATSRDGCAPTVFSTAADAVAELERCHGLSSAQWVYQDAEGEPIGVVVRWDRTGSRKNIRPVSRTPAGWTIGGMPTPRPLYMLPMLRDAVRVYVTEGEKPADAVISLGLICTTSPHGSQSAHSANWSPLAGKQVYVLPDNDEPGEKYAADVVVELAKLTPSPVVKIVQLDDLPTAGDAFDLIESYRTAGAMNDDEIREYFGRCADRTEPLELDTHEPVAGVFQPFPLAALPDPLRVFVDAVAAATGTDAAFAAIAALVVVAGSIGNRVAALVKPGWTEPAVLWGVLVGRSGTTKSPVLKLVTRPLFELFKAERRAYGDMMKEYEREFERHGVRLAEWKKSQRSGPPTDPPEEPEHPAERRLIVSDVTIEKLGCLLEENPLGLLVVSDELAAWVGRFDRYASGGKGSDRPAWLSMYDAASVTIDRKSGKGTYFVDRAAVSVLGSIQPGTLARVFGTAEREAGLLARVLVAYPPDRPALWTDADLSDDVASAWRELLCALLALPAGQDELGDPRPQFIPIGSDAKHLWIEWHDRHARELVDIGNDDLAAHYAKLKGVCPRIALLFACVDVAAGGEAVAHISADAMRRAIRVVEWFKSEARRVYSILGESEDDRESRRLVEWIERRGGRATVRDLTHGLRQYRGCSDVAKAALDGLEKVGAGNWTHPAPGPKGGRPSPCFMLSNTNAVTKTPADDDATKGFGCGDAGNTSTELSHSDTIAEAPDGDKPDSKGDTAHGEDDDWGEV